MEFLIIAIASLLASALTFFSGFGLGTILLPVFALFFPLEVSIAVTAIVHFLNNIFKFILVKKNISVPVLLRFGIPSVIAAVFGAFVLQYISDYSVLGKVFILGKYREIKLINIIIAVVLIFFALFDIIPRLKNLEFSKKYLSIGGFLSGFFGGLSGHQGALRSAFLIRSGLSKESFIATGIAIACFIDISRMMVYSNKIFLESENLEWKYIATATLFAFLGAYLGNRFLKKLTLAFIQKFVAFALIVFSIMLALGFI